MSEYSVLEIQGLIEDAREEGRQAALREAHADPKHRLRGGETRPMLPLRPDPTPSEPRAVVDATGCHWETPEDALGIGLLGFCGCGMADTINADLVAWLRWRKESAVAVEAAREALTATSEPYRIFAIEYDAQPKSPLASKPDEYTDLLGYCLDRAGLVEHGGSVGGSWLTPLGERWLESIDAVSAS